MYPTLGSWDSPHQPLTQAKPTRPEVVEVQLMTDSSLPALYSSRGFCPHFTLYYNNSSHYTQEQIHQHVPDALLMTFKLVNAPNLSILDIQLCSGLGSNHQSLPIYYYKNWPGKYTGGAVPMATHFRPLC